MMAAPPRVVIVADDLTGAMDVAGPLAERGLGTLAVASVDGCTPQHLIGAEVVSINADSRHLGAEDASRRITAIARELLHPDAEILIKKIDSTLRGNVAAETLAMLDASGRRAAVVAPAFPAQGRTVIGGVVHVRGVPLRETNFARDALSPPPLERLHELFERAAPDAHVHAARAGDALAIANDGRRHIFALDSASDDDLRLIVRGLRGQMRQTLLVGSAGIAEALADVCFERAPSPLPTPVTDGQLLFVVGSRAEQSAQQVAALVEVSGAQAFAAPNGHVDIEAAARCAAPVLVLKATPGIGGGEGDAADVARGLADGAARLLERRPVAAMVATGGDTAIAILQRLSQPVLRVMGNLLPGIPFSRVNTGGGDLWFVTKAGGFGGRDTFVAIVQRLRG
jgi:D-threonate/D-erythronate kinase